MNHKPLRKRWSLGFKLAILLVLISISVLAVQSLNLEVWLPVLLRRVKSLGVWAPIAFMGIYVAATLCFIPGSLLTIGAGVLFGVVLGSIYTFLGASLGAIAAFCVSRYMVRKWAQKWITKQLEGSEKFQAVNQAVAREGFRIVLLTRLSPVLPFTWLNYAFGLSQVSLRDYALGCLGMIPATVMYVYIGSLLGDLAALVSGATARSRTLAEVILLSVGLVATVVVTLYITQIARKALDEKAL
uniref:TVP38/TMEM64 family protein n=1 Tax=Trichocoleus desertorum TaxID=1481672 RepID=UPI0025B435CB|nr:TVP38/TMEM64 family protein [Trichocoleus desertorum]